MALTRKRKKSTSMAGVPREARKTKSTPIPDILQFPDTEQGHKKGFLDLAAELRDMIYDCVLEVYPGIFSKKVTHLTSTSGLARVNKQIRSEFLARALTSSQALETTVNNFNFTHVVTFLNRLPEAHLTKLEAAGTERALRINLEFKGPYPVDLELLDRWLHRAGTKQQRSNGKGLETGAQYKKGANVKFQYSAQAAHPAFYLPQTMGLGDCRLYYQRTLTGMLGTRQRSDRRAEEAEKIKQALKQAHIQFERSKFRYRMDDIDSRRLNGFENQQKKWAVWPWYLTAQDIAQEQN